MTRTIGRAAVALAMTALVVAGCSPDSDGGAAPGVILRPGAELNGMRLTTAAEGDAEFFSFCDPFIPQSGTYARSCDVPQSQRLMIGYGSYDDSAELLEQNWQATQWQMYLDGRQVDLVAFGTTPDRYYFEPYVGSKIWLRLWAVTLVNASPGQHTLRYVGYVLPSVGAAPVDTTDATWTFTVVQ